MSGGNGKVAYIDTEGYVRFGLELAIRSVSL